MAHPRPTPEGGKGASSCQRRRRQATASPANSSATLAVKLFERTPDRPVAAQHFLTFNAADPVCRVQDTVAAVTWLRQRSPAQPVEIIASDERASWAATVAQAVLGRSAVRLRGNAKSGEPDPVPGLNSPAASPPSANWRPSERAPLELEDRRLQRLLPRPAFFFASLQLGLREAARAAGIEFLLFAAMAGFTGALIQNVRFLQPLWLRMTILLAGVPAILHTGEWLGHTWLGTPARNKGVLFSVILSGIAALFNLYAMRKGALVAGHEGDSFILDLARLPRLIGGFISWPVRRLLRRP